MASINLNKSIHSVKLIKQYEKEKYTNTEHTKIQQYEEKQNNAIKELQTKKNEFKKLCEKIQKLVNNINSYQN